MESETTDLDAGLSIADAARANGLSVHTLRYYERDAVRAQLAEVREHLAFVDSKIAIYEELIE